MDDISQEIKTVAVFVGRNGFGPWQKAEISGFLHDCIERDIRVIPVLLDNAPPGNPRLPFFLRGRIWIDFRQSEPDPFELLLRGIRGIKVDRQNQTRVENLLIQQAPTLNPENDSTIQIFSRIPSFETLMANVGEKVITTLTQSARFFTEDLGDGVTLDMVAIPGGSFQMGSPDSEAQRSSSESPQHSVTIAPFHMGKFAVTQAQYQAVMGINPSHFKGEKRPVENVSWKDTIAFCQQLSKKAGNLYRLPSEAEWEYACRAGTTTLFHFGETIAHDLANYASDSTYSVGSFPANAFGLYDMHGNVWEWCEDYWHGNYDGAPTDGGAWLTEDKNTPRLLRSGSWRNLPDYCRSAYRSRYSPDYQSISIGFRVVYS